MTCSKRAGDLLNSTVLSRRRLLGALAGLALPVGARAQTRSEDLEGLAVEPEPDFTLVAKFASYDVELLYGVDDSGKPKPGSARRKVGKFKFMTRSWAADGELDDNYLGPLLELEPGQTFKVLVRNELFETGDFENYGPPEPKRQDWAVAIDNVPAPHNAGPIGLPFHNDCNSKTPVERIEFDRENIPKNFNWTNLHLHGLEIDPHLFEPQGTSDPAAGQITIKPGERHLYHFQLPKLHPTGTYWYHPHYHNSVAIQAWGGLAGMLIVRGTFDDELRNHGVTTEIPFVAHDPHYRIEKYPQGDEPGIAKVAGFVQNQTDLTDTTFMVTGRYQPTYRVRKNETVHLRHLTATVESLCGFRIVAAPGTVSTVATAGVEKENLPFYMIASDGIAFEKPVKKNLMVTGGGERHDLLVRFTEPGEYLVKSDYLESVQFYGTGPLDQVLARFVVSDEEVEKPAMPVETMTFTPGIPKKAAPGDGDIQPAEITRRRNFVFEVNGDTCKLPFQQMQINGASYRVEEVNFSVEQGQVEEWVLINPSDGSHPFHVHVNAFQVKEVSSHQTVDPRLKGDRAAIAQSRIEAMRTIDAPDEWRDTLIVPAKGFVRVWTRLYNDRVGKTVLHCHFLAHEESGMMQNFLIEPKSG